MRSKFENFDFLRDYQVSSSKLSVGAAFQPRNQLSRLESRSHIQMNKHLIGVSGCELRVAGFGVRGSGCGSRGERVYWVDWVNCPG